MKRKLITAAILMLTGGFQLPASDFFAIKSVKFLSSPPKDGVAVWKVLNTKNSRTYEFEPCLEVTASTQEDTRSDGLIAKAYFFDKNNNPIASAARPSKSGKQLSRYEMPVIFYKGKPERFFFEIPEAIRTTEWKAVVVFGDKDEARSASYHSTAAIPPWQKIFQTTVPMYPGDLQRSLVRRFSNKPDCPWMN